MKWRVAAASVVLCASALASVPAVAVSTSSPPPLVEVFGDSMETQAYPYFWYDIQQMAKPPKLVEHAWPGTAVCDWLSKMQADATTLHPTAVLLLFVGNDSTPCMASAAAAGSPGDPAQTAAVAAQYATDLTTAINTFLTNGTKYVFVNAGPAYPAYLENYAGAVRAAELSAVMTLANPAVKWVKAGSSVDTPKTNQFTLTRACVPYELEHNLCTGPVVKHVPSNSVRIADGHFCTWPWPKHFFCAGGWRFGNAEATGLMRAFGWTPLPPTDIAGSSSS